MKQKALFISAAVVLLVAFVVGAWVYKNSNTDEPVQPSDPVYSQLIRMHSPTLGKPDAKVQLVEFIDPACEACASFYPLVKKIIATNPDEIRLVLRYAPFHQGASAVVAVLGLVLCWSWFFRSVLSRICVLSEHRCKSCGSCMQTHYCDAFVQRHMTCLPPGHPRVYRNTQGLPVIRFALGKLVVSYFVSFIKRLVINRNIVDLDPNVFGTQRGIIASNMSTTSYQVSKDMSCTSSLGCRNFMIGF